MGRLHEPIWPEGFAGSISHDGRFAAALAYSSTSGRVWLSIDLIDQPDQEIYRGVADTILHPADALGSTNDPLAMARLFSAKEAAIKIVSPYVGDFVDFRSVRAMRTNKGFHVTAPEVGLDIGIRAFEIDNIIVSVGILFHW
jgi:4'-phosphopantetheinyl transferase EntD